LRVQKKFSSIKNEKYTKNLYFFPFSYERKKGRNLLNQTIDLPVFDCKMTKKMRRDRVREITACLLIHENQ
jgi:hypothetical protein